MSSSIQARDNGLRRYGYGACQKGMFMPTQNTHLADHMDNLMLDPFILQISKDKRIKIYQFMGQRRWLFVPQFCRPTIAYGNPQWFCYVTRRQLWATFSFDNALRKLEVEKTGMWRVYAFNEISTEVVDSIDMLDKNKPTRRARKWAAGRFHVIVPIN